MGSINDLLSSQDFFISIEKHVCESLMAFELLHCYLNADISKFIGKEN